MLVDKSFFTLIWRLSLLQEAQSRIFVYLNPCAMDRLESFSNVIGVDSYSEDPSPHPQKHHQTGDWKGMRLGVFIPPKNLSNMWEQLEK